MSSGANGRKCVCGCKSCRSKRWALSATSFAHLSLSLSLSATWLQLQHHAPPPDSLSLLLRYSYFTAPGGEARVGVGTMCVSWALHASK